MRLISACLVGLNTTHEGRNNANRVFEEMLQRGELLPICPEQLGGLTTPRPPAEIKGGSGGDVIKGRAKVCRKDGSDVTGEFIRGAREVLGLAKAISPELIIFKEQSPSCGVKLIHDGTFSNRVISGMGVTTALLLKNGYRVISDEEFLKDFK